MSFSVSILEDTATQMLKSVSENLKAKVHNKISAIGVEMVAYAQSICPVRSGYLRSTIFFIVKVTLEFEFGATAEYAIFVEMGTYRMAAQPFIRPAVETYTSAILDAVVEGVMEACKG